MHARCDIMVTPMGKQESSVTEALVECENIFAKYGLKPNVHALATNVEGQMGKVFDSVKDVFDSLTKMGFTRIAVDMRIVTGAPFGA